MFFPMLFTKSEDVVTDSPNFDSHLFLFILACFSTVIMVILFFLICLRTVIMGQKTRSQQQRRGLHAGSRGRPSLQVEPTIYLSPNNLPAPPKYEALAPPSYEEVMAVTYPAYPGAQPQPIAYPITHAIAQTSQNVQPSPHLNTTRNEEASPSTVITVTAEDRRTSVTVATS